MRVLRAELRAKDDCARALSDFDVLVTQALSASLPERALYGRAAGRRRESCAAQKQA
jgi:hypothetical protein